jgi:hypothetical protein
VSVDLSKKSWLADLVDDELAGYDPVAARLRLPPEVRQADPDGPSLEARSRMLLVRSLRLSHFTTRPGEEENTSAFLSPIRDHIGLILDLALLQGGPFERARRGAEIAGFFAAAMGENQMARQALPRGQTISAVSVKRALVRSGTVLRNRCFPPGDPLNGIPLYAGTLVVLRRHLGRVALAYHHKGALDRSTLSQFHDQASLELACLAEALVVLTSADGPLDTQRRRAIQRQIVRLGLKPDLAQGLIDRLVSPRSEADIARCLPARLRPFLVGQVLLASVGSELSTEREQVIARFAEAAQLGGEEVASMGVEAAAFHASHAPLFQAFDLPDAEWDALAAEWDQAGEDMVERITAVLSDNLEAIVTEVKQTGELGQLLAQAAAGKVLTAEEKSKVKAQLIDLARAVPALAIFAAPGGMLLLPLLAKLLPFQLLPTSFYSPGKKGPPPENGNA